MTTSKPGQIIVENVNHPGSARSVDAAMYRAMKRAYLAVLPKTAPGLTRSDIQQRLLAHLPDDLFQRGREGWLVGKDRAARPRGERRHRARKDETASRAQGVTPRAVAKRSVAKRSRGLPAGAVERA